MEERRKIVIPIGEKPQTPQFDAEETLLSARPVVPLASDSARDREAQPIARVPFYRRASFLSLIVLVSVGLGLTAGLGIARYRYLRNSSASAPIAAQPAQTDTRATTVQASEGNQQAQAPQLPEVKTDNTNRSVTNETDEAAKADEGAQTAPASAKVPDAEKDRSTSDNEDEDRASTTARRDNKGTDDNEEESDDATRAQRRNRRQRNRDDELTVPRTIERTTEQINRIREIFEGQRQRP